jgi:exosome complex component RRP41
LLQRIDGWAVQVIATVAGPAAAASQRGDDRTLPVITCSVLTAPFCGGPRRYRHRNDGRSLALQQCIQNAVLQSVVPDVLRHSQIDISVVITDADGGVDCCAVNAAMLAVADAGAVFQPPSNS